MPISTLPYLAGEKDIWRDPQSHGEADGEAMAEARDFAREWEMLDAIPSVRKRLRRACLRGLVNPYPTGN